MKLETLSDRAYPDEAPPTNGTKTIEEWREAKATSDWDFAGATTLNGWAIGKRLTEKEYDAGVDAFRNVTFK
jgi:hypothetical protein